MHERVVGDSSFAGQMMRKLRVIISWRTAFFAKVCGGGTQLAEKDGTGMHHALGMGGGSEGVWGDVKVQLKQLDATKYAD